MHSQLTDRSVVVVRGGVEQAERERSLRSGASVYHGLRGHRDAYDIHFQTDGTFNHKGKRIDKKRLFQTNATVFNALHGNSAGQLAKASGQYKTKHTGNSHLHRAEMRNHHSRRKILQKHGIDTIPHWKINTSQTQQPLDRSIKKQLTYPVIITPLPSSFSSNSLVVETESELDDILQSISQKQSSVHLQKSVQGSVFSGLLLPKFREQTPYAFPVFKKQHDREFVNSVPDSEGEYRAGRKGNQDLQAILKKVFDAAQLHCLARIDIAKSRQDNHYLLNVETHPRLDRHSLLAVSTDRVGALMKDVFEQQVTLARKR